MILHIYFIFFLTAHFYLFHIAQRDNSTLRVVPKKKKKKKENFKSLKESYIVRKQCEYPSVFPCGAQNPDLQFYPRLIRYIRSLLYISTKAFFFYSIFFAHTSFNSCKIIYIHLYRYTKEICTTVYGVYRYSTMRCDSFVSFHVRNERKIAERKGIK